jgi:prephenate dehydrogenase
MRFDTIAIVGLGLIGGSFALAVRRAGIAGKITGCGTREAIEYALAHNVIDEAEESFESGKVSDADLVYLATPVRAIIDFLRTRAGQIKPGAIVTDAGSTKREICRAATESLPPAIHFIGGHPMAGSQKTGIENASADIFNDAPYALVTVEAGVAMDSEFEKSLNTMIDIVGRIGSHPIMITPDRHDRVVARISHAPQLLSTALAVAVAKGGEQECLELAGTGFADMTRLAASRWSVWEDVCRTNADEIRRALDEIIIEIETMRAALAESRFSSIRNAFEQANEIGRDSARRT